MIKRVLIVTLIFMVLALAIFWLLEGGFSAAARTAQSLTNPVDLIWGTGRAGGPLTLPWQPAELPRGPDVSQSAREAAQYQAEMGGGQEQNFPAAQAQTFGNPSPREGEVAIAGSDATARDPALEYVEIEASANNAGPVNITGWSLQSALSGERAYVGQGAPVFVQGVVNESAPMYLDPGATAIITSGPSPVGASFKENICSGYLGEFQSFSPEIPADCPKPANDFPETPGNLRAYGSHCFDYVQNLPACAFPLHPPAGLSSACETMLVIRFSYDGCVEAHRNDPGFALPVWRVYLGSAAGLWNDAHDIVRLLDDKGRTVDALTY